MNVSRAPDPLREITTPSNTWVRRRVPSTTWKWTRTRSPAEKRGTRSRVQVFQGVVIRRQGSGARETFTVRKVSFGVGVERTFPVHSPNIDRIELFTRGDVRRAKLYYLRELRGKAAKIKEKREAPAAS